MVPSSESGTLVRHPSESTLASDGGTMIQHDTLVPDGQRTMTDIGSGMGTMVISNDEEEDEDTMKRKIFIALINVT